MTYMTKNAFIMVDGAFWKNMSTQIMPVKMVRGLRHGHGVTGSYRNVIFGLIKLVEMWPDADWYCHMDYDTLVVSSNFVEDLVRAKQHGYACVGIDHRIEDFRLPYLEWILGEQMSGIMDYLFGALYFFDGEFLRRLVPFLERFLLCTNDFTKQFFPGYDIYPGLDEHLLPSIVTHYGGRIITMARWNKEGFDGNHERYALRHRPEVQIDELSEEASIIHPVKEYDNPIRVWARERRKFLKNS